MTNTRIIAVVNQKGGVGKTTTTTNLAHGLARKGNQVLAIDLDPQAQMTVSLGMQRKRDMGGLEKALLKGEPLIKVTYPVRDNLNLVPAGYGLVDVENLSDGGASRGQLLKKAIADVASQYEYILIDCPPSSGLLIVNAIFAANEILIPMTGDYLALQGMSHLMGTLRNFESALGQEIKRWIVLSKFQGRRRLSREVQEKLVVHFPGKVLKTVISESVLLAESPSFGKTIYEYKPSSRSATEYETLVDDLIQGRVN